MSVVVHLCRARDLLDIELEFVNLMLDTSDPAHPRLARQAAGPARIVMRLPPQHIAEEAFTQNSQRSPPYKSFLACPSSVSFALPDTVVDIPFSTDGLLSVLSGLETTVTPSAGDPGTVIAFPDGLLLIPEPGTRLRHRATTVVSTATLPHRTELWHTRLVAGSPNANLTPRFRAVRNLQDLERFPTSQTSLQKSHRDDIISHSTRDPLNRHVIASREFALTALGASAQLASAWPPDDQTTLVAWDHETRLGRDCRVQTVEQGYLYPWRHRAALVTITERTIGSSGTISVGELIQRQFLTFQEVEKNYSDVASAYPFEGREMPFQQIRFELPHNGELPRDAPVIQIDATLRDASDQVVACKLPALFVPSRSAADSDTLAELKRLFDERNVVECGNQRVALANESAGTDASLTVERLRMSVVPPPDLKHAIDPPFLPFFASADVRVPAVEHLLGTVGGGARVATTIELHDQYRRAGFGPDNAKQAFVRFQAALPPLSIPAQRAGGLAAPTFKGFDALSRLSGPSIDSAEIDAHDLLGETKLLGMIPLAKLVPAKITAAHDQLAGLAPEKLFDQIDSHPQVMLTQPIITTVRDGARVETRFVWKPHIPNIDPSLPLRPADGGITLLLKGRLTKTIGAAGAPGFEVRGKLSNFALEFKDLVSIGFDDVEFRSGEGVKMDVKVRIRGLTFLGALAFVRKLQTALPLDIFGGRPIVQPLPDGVRVGYAIPVPAVPLGIFNLQNVAVAMSASLSFVEGKPAAVRFSLSERHQPFLVSASIFGGTGYFALEVRTDGTIQIDAAIEFGGVVAFNVFIAKGAVYVFVGIFVSVKPTGHVLIEGHLRLGGRVEVLGLVSVSIEVYIGLEYDSARNVLAGTGRVTVSVTLLFFSESVSFSVHKEISGFGEAPSGGGDVQPVALGGVVASARLPAARITAATRPARLMDAGQWRTYCSAFS
jgi:hypothetical protein